MADETLIQWCDRTWSPWFGCRKVSPGCDNCYIVRTVPFRMRGLKHGPRRDDPSESYWELPYRWNREAVRTEKRLRVFPSVCDPFDTEVDYSRFERFMETIIRCPKLDWLLLTKRIENALPLGQRWAKENGYNWTGFPPNVWLGASVEDQKRADERIPILLSIPAKVRFLSVEPMLEHIELDLPHRDAPGPSKIDWVIFGGESGRGARPCSIAWIKDGLEQCWERAVVPFVKQVGSNAVGNEMDKWVTRLKHKKGGDPSEWPANLRVREFPSV